MSVDFAEMRREHAAECAARRESARAIKACLDSLKTDARAFALRDLERFLELAALAAEEAAEEMEMEEYDGVLRDMAPAGAC